MYSFLRFSIASLKTSEFKILSASAALTASSCVTDIYKLNNPLGVCGNVLPILIGDTISSTLGWAKLETGKLDNLVRFIGGIGCGTIGCGITGMFGITGICCGFGMFAKIFCGNGCAGITGAFIGCCIAGVVGITGAAGSNIDGNTGAFDTGSADTGSFNMSLNKLTDSGIFIFSISIFATSSISILSAISSKLNKF